MTPITTINVIASPIDKSPYGLHIHYTTYIFGAQGGNRTRTTFGQGILSPSRLPVPPLALIFIYTPEFHQPALLVLYYIYEANCNSSRRVKF